MKKRKKIKLSPLTVLFILIIATILLSAILTGIGKIKINNTYPFSFLSQGTYSTINSTTGELENQFVEVETLLNRSGIQYVIGNIVTNFITFAPLSMLLIGLIGFAVAEKSGLIKTLASSVNPKTPSWVFTALLIFLGIVTTLSSDIAYVILIPLGAVLFSINKRNPMCGIIASFAGIAGGYAVNALIGTMDINLSTYTQMAARLLDAQYAVRLSGNYFFMLIATIAIVIIGTIITEKLVMPNFSNRLEETDELFIITKKEKRGLFLSVAATVIVLAIFIYMIVPGLPFSGLLLDTSVTGYINQLFSSNSYFQQGLIVLVAVLLFIAGLFYGIGARTIKSDKDVVSFITNSKNNIGYLLVLIFFAAQFIAIFKKTNIGTMINIWLVNIIKTSGMSGLPLIIIFFVIAMIGNIFLPSPPLKWSIMAPAIVPVFMQANLSPEFAQMIYRLAISASNLITPLLAYYVIYLGYLQIYNRKDETITIGQSFKYLKPYFLIFAASFLLLIIIWYIIGAPIGPGVLPTL